MNKLALMLGLLAITSVSTASASTAEQIKHFAQDIPTRGQRAVEIHNAVGNIILEAGTGDTLHADVVVRCGKDRDKDSERCQERAEKIELSARTSGDTLILEVENFPRNSSGGLSVDLRIKAPAGLNLHLEHGVGNVEVSGMTRDVHVELGVGDVKVNQAASAVREADLNAGVGDVTLMQGEERLKGKGFVGKQLAWRSGTGSSRLELQSGVGNVKLRLE